MNDASDLAYGMGRAPEVEPMAVRVIQDTADWDAIRADWDQLYAVSPTAAAPLDFAWLRCWWRVFGSVYGVGGLRIITLWRGRELVGALPLYIDSGRGGICAARCLRFVSTGEAEYEETCPDYLNLLHLPGEEVACAQAAWGAVEALEWDTLEFLDLPQDSPLVHGREFFSRHASLRIGARGGCPIANIEGGYETYLTQLSSKTRKRARQEVRKAELSGAVLEVASDAETGAYFDDLIRLHQARWTAEGRLGCFSAPRFTEFHEYLAREWSKSGRLVLARLSCRGQACVVLYGFVTGTKFDLYQLGVNPIEGTPIHSPGTVANLLLMAELVNRGVTRYDFLRGTSVFKKSLTTEQRDLICLQCSRLSVRALIDQGNRLVARVGRKMIRLTSRR